MLLRLCVFFLHVFEFATVFTCRIVRSYKFFSPAQRIKMKMKLKKQNYPLEKNEYSESKKWDET